MINKKDFYQVGLIFIGIVLAFIASMLIDYLFGYYLLKTGYFKLMQPNITEVYETSEFKVNAKISSQGIRNEEVVVPKPKGVYRILAIGDSFTFGWGVNLEDSWPKVLEKLLANNINLSKGEKVEVINAGVGGGDSASAIETCRRYQYFDADLIIFGFFSTDDLYQAASNSFEKKKDNFKSKFFPNITQLSNQILFPNYYRVSTDGKIYHTIDWRNRAEVIALAFRTFFSSLNINVQKELLTGQLNPGLVIQSRADSDYLVKMLDKNNAELALKGVDQDLRRAKSVCSKIPMILVFLPSQELVSKDFFQYKKDLGYKVSDQLLTLSFDTELKKITEKYGYYFVSLLDEFRKMQCLDCFYNYDMHLTLLGNRVVAEYLMTKIFKIQGF